MSHEVIVLICGQQRNVNKIRFRIPIAFKILNDINEIETFIDSHFPPARFIALLLDKYDQDINAIVVRLSNKSNVIATLMCDNSTVNLPNLQNVLQISKHLITYKTTLYSIHAYNLISKELYESGNAKLGAFFQNEAENLFQWITKNIELMACHVLIIPLNANRRNLIDCQQATIDMCKRLCRDKEIRVCTFYDYILFEESDFNVIDSSNESKIKLYRQLRAIILSRIQKLAPIRLYLVGNEIEIVHHLSKVLVARESNTNPSGAQKYIDACTFIEYEPVSPQISNDVARFLRATTWQLDRSKTKPVRLDFIERDDNFKNALESVHDTLPKREEHTKVAVWMNNTKYCETTSDCSDQFHSIDQAENCRNDEDEDSTEAINIRMQRDYRKSPQNR